MCTWRGSSWAARRKTAPGLRAYALELREEFSITLLASTVSLTPGTVSADVSADRSTLLIHALDVDRRGGPHRPDQAALRNTAEEIFEC
jgi:multicomponent K+:H+ antiporter subunit E